MNNSTSKLLSDLESGNTVVSRVESHSDINEKLLVHPIFNDLVNLKDLTAIRRSVFNLIMTNQGERPFKPFLGGDVSKYLFETPSPLVIFQLKNKIRYTLETFESRVEVLDIDIIDDSDRNAYHVSLTFQAVETGKDIEIDFYLERIR